jgi:ribonuclease P protein component
VLTVFARAWQPAAGDWSLSDAGPRVARALRSDVSDTARSLRPDLRLRPSNRIRKSADFQRVFAKSKRSADEFFTILYRPSDSSSARLGFAISAKRVRTAVGRNRLRRLVRESFRAVQSDLQGLDIVAIAREQANRADKATLRQSLSRHWAILAPPRRTEMASQ